MKKIKFAFSGLIIVLFVFTSCENNTAIIEEQQTTTKSQSITTVLNELRNQFNQNRTLNTTNNPSGNIIFDFCFDFSYPLNLAYNNDVTLTANNLTELTQAIFNSTENLYINGITFPFNVETYNQDTNTIEITSINDEEEFSSLITNCNFEEENPCICPIVTTPVCIEIINPEGGTFIINYRNTCLAQCDGFTEDDMMSNCENYYNPIYNLDCFTLNFPVSVLVDNSSTISVSSIQELNTVIYGSYIFSFAFPISITLSDSEIEILNNNEELLDLIENCNNCNECDEQPLDIVCIETTTPTGEVEILYYPNTCYAFCSGYTEADFVNCGNSTFCSTDEMISLLTSCPWTVVTNDEMTYAFVLNPNNTVTITGNGTSYSANWTLTSGDTDTDTLNVVIINGNNTIFNNEWIFLNCNPDNLSVTSNNAKPMRIEQDCD